MNQENEISGLKGKIAELEVKLEAALYELKALKQNEEKYKGIIENSRDITEKRGTEQEIWELQNRYETIVRNFPQGAIFLFDSDLRYKMIAGAILKIIGVKSEDLEGKTVYDLFPEEFSSVTGPIAKGLFNNQTAFFEIVFLKRIYACWGLPVKNEKGQITEGLIYALDITDLKNKEKELEASKRELELVTENIPNVIWKADIDKNGKFINTYISDVVDEFLALPPKTINHDWDKYFSYINPDFIPDILNKFKDGFSNLGQTISFEYEIKKANGELAWFLSSGRAYFENDRVTVYGYTTDVTERKLVERQVKQSEEKFRNLYNNLPVGIFRSLPDGQVLYANPAMLKMYGYESEGELLKVSAKDYYVDNTDREAILRMLKENGVLRNHITHEFRKDETDIWVKTDYSAIFGDNGEIKYIEGVIEDFTERKKAEQALKESEEKFQKIFFHSPILVTLSNVEDGRYIDVNAKFLEVSQFAYDEVIGKTSTELGWVSDSDMKKLTDQIIKNGRISDMEIPFQTKTGKHILCTYHGELINIGGSTCLLSIAEDITEWKKIEKQLVAAKEKAEESDRLKSAFLATMSHELRTPLNAVIGFSEYLIDEYESPDKVKAYGKMINNGGKQLLNIIEDIFLLSLIESGEIKITVED
ncbi:MAG: PAS domain S-box protein, partial [Bacteroidetes bacterium]|nr:PAS domain S-box protein [Bacteroidota bacterium]